MSSPSDSNNSNNNKNNNNNTNTDRPQLSPYALEDAALPFGFSAIQFPVAVDKVRSILSIDQYRCLVLERADGGTSSGTNHVVLLSTSRTRSEGIMDERRIVVSAPSINHGLAIHNGYLYASSDSLVYRWPYDAEIVEVTGEMETIIENMNHLDPNGDLSSSQGNHVTRSLIFDEQDRLYVSVGSFGNIDADSFRSRIRRFVLPSDDTSSSFPLNFVEGEVFGDGLRNEVGLAWDRHGVLWGVQTGPDRLDRADLGGSIINEDNAAELLHAFRQDGLHYGYPYCWMEYNLPKGVGMGPGTMWAWPSFMDTVSDEDCRDTSQYTPAELPMQAHSSPLGMAFYEYKQDVPVGCSGAFSEWMDGYAFIAFHGSWNRQVPTGYKVVYVPMDANGRVAADDAIDLLAHIGSDANWPSGMRPVDVDFDECGRLLVTSDGTKGSGTMVIRVEYINAADGAGDGGGLEGGNNPDLGNSSGDGREGGNSSSDPRPERDDLSDSSSSSPLPSVGGPSSAYGSQSLLFALFIFVVTIRNVML